MASSSARIYQYGNVPAATIPKENESYHQYRGSHQRQNSFEFCHGASYYASTLVERGRRNPCMIGSVIVAFLLLVVSHHHKDPSTERPRPYWPPMITDESASLTNGGDNATVPSRVLFVPASSKHDLKSSTKADVTPQASPSEPLLAYLLSYPMSGTSYTLSLIRSLPPHSLTFPSNAATNYGIEAPLHPDTKNNYPVFASSPQGPFYLDPINDLEVDKYVVSLSHCTGHCPDCSVDQFMESESSFEEACRTTHYYHYTDDNQKKYVAEIYGSSLPKKAIHLVRDPLNNIVSLFHLERHERERRAEKSWLKDFPDDMTGFQKWCSHLDAKYEKEELHSKYFSAELRNRMKRVPCHDEVYKYVQWHNYVHQTFMEMTQSAVPISTIYYEDFETQLLEVANKLSTFLELNPVKGDATGKGTTVELVDSDLPVFLEGKSYHEFYTDEQVKNFWKLVECLAVKGVWNDVLGRYHNLSSELVVESKK